MIIDSNYGILLLEKSKPNYYVKIINCISSFAAYCRYILIRDSRFNKLRFQN